MVGQTPANFSPGVDVFRFSSLPTAAMQSIVQGLSSSSEAEKQGAFSQSPQPHPVRASCTPTDNVCVFARDQPVRAATLAKLEELQVKDTLRMFNGLVERCFGECVHAFRSKMLTEPEEKCVTTCSEKYLKHTNRVGQRFGELSMQEQQAQQQASQQAPS